MCVCALQVSVQSECVYVRCLINKGKLGGNLCWVNKTTRCDADLHSLAVAMADKNVRSVICCPFIGAS